METLSTRTRLPILGALVVFMGLAWAQEAPPAETPAEEPEETLEVKPTNHLVEIGYSAWTTRGNFQKWLQYGNPPKGLGIRRLELLFPGKDFAKLRLAGDLNRDSVAEGTLRLDQGRGLIKFSASRNLTHDPSPVLTERGFRNNYELDATYMLGQDTSVYFQHRQQSRQKDHVAPYDDARTVTKTYNFGVDTIVSGGNLGVQFGDSRHYDRTGVLPKTVLHTTRVNYAHPVGETANLEGSATYTRIEQPAKPVGEVRSLKLSGDWAINPLSTIFITVRRDDLDLPMVANNAIRQRFLTSVKFAQTLGVGNLTLGYQRKSSERFRNDRTYVDVPTWDNVEAALNGVLGNGLRYTVKGSWNHLQKQPTFQTEDDSRGLYWDDRLKFSVSVRGGNDRFNGYASYGLRFDQNSARDVEIKTHTIALGGNYNVSTGADLYFELLNETSAARGLVSETGLSLDSFFPSWTSIALGYSQAMGEKDAWSIGFNHTFARNDNPVFEYGGNVRMTQLTGQFNHTFSPTETLGIVVSPWRYDDKIDSSARYRASVVSISYTLKF